MEMKNKTEKENMKDLTFDLLVLVTLQQKK